MPRRQPRLCRKKSNRKPRQVKQKNIQTKKDQKRHLQENIPNHEDKGLEKAAVISSSSGATTQNSQDDEICHTGAEDPKITNTTSRESSARSVMFANESRVTDGSPPVSKRSFVFCKPIEELREILPLETPLGPRKCRVLIPKLKLPDGAQSLWSSLEVSPICSDPLTPIMHVEIVGSCDSTPHSDTSQPSTSRARVKRSADKDINPPASKRAFLSCKPIEELREVLPLESCDRPKRCRVLLPKPQSTAGSQDFWPLLEVSSICSDPLSTAEHVELGESRDSGKSQPSASRAGEKRYADTDENGPASEQSLSPSSSTDANQILVEDVEIDNLLDYGSEGESEEEDEERTMEPLKMPRVARMFLYDDKDEDNLQPTNTNATVTLEWPPLPHAETVMQPEANADLHLPAPLHESGIETESKLSFKWRAFSECQFDPKLRREPFSNIDCGPTTPLLSPYDAFTAIWDHNIMEHIVKETNRYAQQLTTEMLFKGTICPNSRITKWRDTDVSELYVYFAILLATGVVVKSRIEEYWNKSEDIVSTPGFTVSMRYDRFRLLTRCLHFQNNQLNTDLETMSRSEAKLYKIRPIIDHLNNKFSQLYNMSQNIALDDSLTMWKGWLDINQFIHNKAAKVGIKTYEVCESKTGYLWRFEVHAGHDASSAQDDRSPISGIIPSLVLRLLNGLEHKGHTVWMDNFYNSPALARELKTRGFDCVGTLRTNKALVPAELASINKNVMEEGQLCGCTSGDVDLILWRDKNRVALISTYHGLATVKCGDTLKPSVISDYNICMGGVDLKDQMLAAYPIERKRCRIWYKKFFRRLLNVSVLNAYILHKTQQSISHRRFRRTLVNQILAKHSPPSPRVPVQQLGHYPAQYDFLAGKNHERQRRLCTVCRKRTNAYCRGCNVPLCIFTCFEPHHTSQKH